MAPQIDYSSKEERLEFIQEKYSCKAPACGNCLSCKLPNGLSAIETFALIRQIECIALARSYKSMPINEFDSIARPLIMK